MVWIDGVGDGVMARNIEDEGDVKSLNFKCVLG